MTTEPLSMIDRKINVTIALFGVILGAGIIWALWPVLVEMGHRWSHDARYSHGYLVPVFAAYLLWHRRGELRDRVLAPGWWGLLLFGVGVGLYLLGGSVHIKWFEGFSILWLLAGLAALLGGWPALRWSWPAVGFLVFMLPLPYRIETGLGGQLQRVATWMSTYTLQTLGLPALSEGNVIQLSNGVNLGVVEACSGLGMLSTFIAFAAGVALVVRRPLIDRIVIVLSAIPIALTANVIRITATGVLHETIGSRLANLVFHDLAGWLMMPLALAMLYVELLLLSRLFVDDDRAPAAVFDFAGAAVRSDTRMSRPKVG